VRLKLTDQNKALLLDLNFRTALLESVGWNETQSASLLEYLQSSLVNNLEMPDQILNNIYTNYGQDAHDLIKKMFLDEYIDNGLYRKQKDDYEH